VKPYPSFESPDKHHWVPSEPELDTFKDIEIPGEKETKKHKLQEEKKQKTAKKEVVDAEHTKEKKRQDAERHKTHKSEDAKIEKIKQEDEISFEEKQEKRQRLIKRSLEYKKLYEEAPIPHDSVILGKLLVAEHILALHEQIEKPKKNAILSKEELLDAFDYMGTLSEKFENPEEESSPEVQEAYDTLLVLAQDALEQNDTPAPIIEANRAHATHPAGVSIETSEKIPQPDAPAAEIVKPIVLPKTTAALVSALLAMRTPKPKPRPTANPVPLQPASPAGGDSVVQPQSITYLDSEHTRSLETILPPPRPSLSPVEARQAYREATRAEHIALRPLHPSKRIAAIAVASALAPAFRHEQPTTANLPPPPAGGAREYSFAPPPPPPKPAVVSHHELTSLTYSHAKPVTTHAETVHSYISSTPYKRPEISSPAPFVEVSTSPLTVSPTEINEQRSSRKIEHLPLQTLLVMAESIPIGHGQRLRRAYEKGEIDKDGLIKVLKSRSKNLDFIREFKQQSERHRALIQASPEFLSSSKNSPNTQPDQGETQIAWQPMPTTQMPVSHLSEGNEQLLKDVLSPRQKQAEETPTGWKTLLLIAGGITVVVALIIVIFMLK